MNDQPLPIGHAAVTGAPAQPSLKQRVLIAGAWSLVSYGLSQIIRFGSNLLMTRLLAPEMFGLMAIASALLVAFAMIFDLGLKPNIVQSRRGTDAGFLNTAWSLQVIHGVLITLAMAATAVAILVLNGHGVMPDGSVYSDPHLPLVILGISITGIIAGFQSTKLHEASRAVTLGRITQIELVAQAVGVASMLVWAAIDGSIWALIAGAVASRLTTTVLSHVVLPGIRNRLQWDASAFSEIVKFGKWIILSSVLGFFVNNGDRLLLGWLLSPALLGAYAIALLIVSTIDQILAKVSADITFPALSEVARRRSRIKSAYYKIQVVFTTIAYLCAGAFMKSGEFLIGFLYDARYSDAGWMVEILAVSLLTAPFRTATQSLLALGMPRVMAIVIGVRLIALVCLTISGFHSFGLPGAIWGIALSHFSYVPVLIFFGIKHEFFDWKKELLLLPVIGLGVLLGEAVMMVLGALR